MNARLLELLFRSQLVRVAALLLAAVGGARWKPSLRNFFRFSGKQLLGWLIGTTMVCVLQGIIDFRGGKAIRMMSEREGKVKCRKREKPT